MFMQLSDSNYRYESFLFIMGFPLLAQEHEIEIYFKELYFPTRVDLDEVKSLLV